MNRAPSPSEVEVSVLGRGYGESVLVHLGDAQWFIVDSLRQADKAPAPLSYLEAIGMDPQSAVRLILATHWHDDHVGGLSALYKSATNAELAMSLAMHHDEVKAFFSRVRGSGSERFGSGVGEMSRIAVIQHQDCRAPIRFAVPNRSLMRIPENKCSHAQPISIEALSPSDADIAAFIDNLANVGSTGPGRRAMPFHRNDISVAVWVSIGPHRVLLGADLETSVKPDRGWQAVLNSPAPLSARANIFKVPHHGSQNGHHQPVWDRLLQPNPIAVLTTWNRGHKLPTIADVNRITSLTQSAFSTSQIDRRSPRRPAAVERTIKEAGAKLRSHPLQVGHVRMRLDLQDPQPEWRIELLSGSIHLSTLAA